MKVATRRLLEEQLVVVAILGSGKKSDAMWHVPQTHARMFSKTLASENSKNEIIQKNKRKR